MSEKNFDHIIKQKLEGYLESNSTADWAAFKQKFDADLGGELSDMEFDQSIKDKLTDPIVTIPAADWSGFSSKLNNQITADVSDEEFDALIQDKVDSPSIEMPGSDWSSFSAKMKDSLISDSAMDAGIKDKLENHEVNYEESHWPILQTKMAEYAQLKNNILSIKWFEGILAILLFITFSNYVADYIPNTPSMALVSPTLQETNVGTEERSTSTISPKDNKTNKVIAPSQNNLVVVNSTDVDQKIGSHLPRVEKITTENTSANQTAINRIVSHESTHSGTPPTFQNNGSLENAINENLIAPMIPSENKIGPLVETTDLLPSIALNQFNKAREEAPMTLKKSAYVNIEKPVKNGLYVHAISGLNFNTVSTPLDTLYGYKGYQSLVESFQYGVNISKEFGNMELISGINYQKIAYAPYPVIETVNGGDDKFYDLSLENITYQFVSIPLQTRWHHALTPKFNLFADLGCRANVLAYSDYGISKTETQSSSGTLPQPIDIDPEGPLDPSLENSRLNRKYFQNGLFEGGSLQESVSLSLSSGLGLQYQISPSFGIYSRVSISQSIGNYDLGPNSDRISHVATQIGLKYKLR